jgi:predicted alpha/beta-fold hydrolase
MYHRFFLKSLVARLRRKARLFPEKFDLAGLSLIRTLRAYDDAYTAPDGGYLDAADYYERSGARHMVGKISVPTLILTAQDDPLIPYRLFQIPALTTNPWIRVVVTAYGGHCGFIQRRRPGEDMFWAENRLIDFIAATEGRRDTSSAPSSGEKQLSMGET